MSASPEVGSHLLAFPPEVRVLLWQGILKSTPQPQKISTEDSKSYTSAQEQVPISTSTKPRKLVTRSRPFTRRYR
jgi:hypothetical protein